MLSNDSKIVTECNRNECQNSKCIGLTKGFSYIMDSSYDPVKNCTIKYPIENEENDLYLVENLLTPQECEDIVTILRNEEFKIAEGFNPDQRSSKRKRTYDPLMSKLILERLMSFIPMKTITIDECEWEVDRFMPFWRYCKYSHSDKFEPHYDGCKKLIQPKEDIYEMTVYTLNIYLNDGFEKGGTRFYMKCQERAPRFDIEAAGEVTHVIPPKKGSALVFNHCNKGYLHDGEALDVSQTEVKDKYIMRADLIYRCNPRDIPILKKKSEEGTCRFWNLKHALEGIVEEYVVTKFILNCVNKTEEGIY
jgi:hypothetical protein